VDGEKEKSWGGWIRNAPGKKKPRDFGKEENGEEQEKKSCDGRATNASKTRKGGDTS